MLLDDGVDKQIVRFLSHWYSNQEACVRWHNCTSTFFTIGNGTRQGGVLSPLLFTRYIKQILVKLVSAQIGCHIGGIVMNVLVYADDIVLLAPAWRAMQRIKIFCRMKLVRLIWNAMWAKLYVWFSLLEIGACK